MDFDKPLGTMNKTLGLGFINIGDDVTWVACTLCVDPDSGWDDEDNDVTWLVCTLCVNSDDGINSSESSSKSRRRLG